ncbi:MAG: ATP-binding protein [Alphaproteobacteria bacterium]|nr:ATP-binding protein [Alphaproteobacteria bacterium]
MTDKIKIEQITPLLMRMADALERLAPAYHFPENLDQAEGFIWEAQLRKLQKIEVIERLPLSCLQGIEHQKQQLLENSRAFAKGLRANNALLWGARGTGKSSLLKAVHGQLITEGLDCAIVEIQREDIQDLPFIMQALKQSDRRFILFCDDLAFEEADASYKSLKAVLEGGLSGRPDNIVFYATSNRRHLMPRQMIDNERGSAINPSEAIEEKISLSDRFGLWIGFHSIDQETYLAMIENYVNFFGLSVDMEQVKSESLTWCIGRGHRSGRTAYQFITNLAGKLGVILTPNSW